MTDNLGSRVRQLRGRLGLSQGELAQGLVSGSYISLIEAGKRIPEREVVEVLAERLGVTTDFLESGQQPVESREEELALRYAEIALANGQIAEAFGKFRSIARTGSFLTVEARWGLARCHEAQGQLEEATTEVEWLLAETRAGRADTPGLLPLLITQCRIYRESGDLGHAIDLAEKGLAEVRQLGLDGTEEEVRLASTLVGCYWQRGDWMRAQLLAEDVIKRAEAHGSRRSRGSVYWNASLVAENRGRLSLALELAERALALFAEGEDERSIALLRMNLAGLVMTHEPVDLARAGVLLASAQQALSGAGLEIELAYCETELARLAVLEGRAADARATAERALGRLRDGSAQEAIRLNVVLALACLALDDRAGADQAVATAERLLAEAGPSRKSAAAWRELAELQRLRGDQEAAVAAYRAMADAAGLADTMVAPVAAIRRSRSSLAG